MKNKKPERKMTIQDEVTVKKLYHDNKHSIESIAKMFNVDYTTISRIINNIKPKKQIKSHPSTKDIIDIITAYNDGVPKQKLASIYNITVNTVTNYVTLTKYTSLVNNTNISETSSTNSKIEITSTVEKRTLSDDEKVEANKLHWIEKVPLKDLAKKYDVSLKTLKYWVVNNPKIKNKKNNNKTVNEKIVVITPSTSQTTDVKEIKDLTNEEIIEMNHLYWDKRVIGKDLAKKYNIAIHKVQKYVKNKKYYVPMKQEVTSKDKNTRSLSNKKELIVEINRLYYDVGMTAAAIAEKYNIGKSTIGRYVRKKKSNLVVNNIFGKTLPAINSNNDKPVDKKDLDIIKKLYFEENLTISQLAEILDIDKQVIHEYIENYLLTVKSIGLPTSDEQLELDDVEPIVDLHKKESTNILSIAKQFFERLISKKEEDTQLNVEESVDYTNLDVESIRKKVLDNLRNNKVHEKAKELSRKLTLKDAKEIRRLCFVEGMTQIAIAKLYNVSPTTIGNIIYNKRYLNNVAESN